MASNSGAIRAGKAYYELYADRNPLTKGLKAAEGTVRASVKTVSAQVLAMGAKVATGIAAAVGAVAAPAAAAKIFASMGTELTDIAKRTGASAASLSTLGYAAKQTGSDLGGIAGLLTGIRDKTIEAARGSDQAQLAFARLGINFIQLSTLKPEDQLRLIADRLNAIPNPMLRAAAAAELLGSADMLPTLNRLTELEARAKRLGLVMSNEDAAAAKAFQTSLNDLWESLKFLGETLGAKIAPLLQGWIDSSIEIVGKSKAWIASNLDIARSAEKLWINLKLAWAKGSDFLQSTWEGMAGGMEGVWIDTSATIGKGWAIAMFAMKCLLGEFTFDWSEKWSHIGETLVQATKDMAEAFKTIWNNTLNWFGRRWVEVKEVAGIISKPVAAKARQAIEAGKKAAGLDDPELQDKLAAIEAKRVAARKSLQDRLNAAKAGRGDAIKALQDDLDKLKDDADEKRAQGPAANAGRPAAKAGTAAQAGIGGAIVHTKGIGAEDVRTSGGFRGIAESLRQTGHNPMLGILQQQWQLQQQEANDLRQLRIHLLKVSARRPP